MEKINDISRDYATKCHKETNHLYDGKPYRTHLNLVVKAMKRFNHLIPEEDNELVEAACWVHDVIEDCRQTYNDVKNICGEQVAEIAYALTNNKGKSRKERANDNYYDGILKVKYAPFVKLCDRIANIEYSKEIGSRMFEVYCKENDDFIRKIYKPEYNEMSEYLLIYCSV
jgi:(p)ppGpp synthase/HD superfamily hydrolase